METVPVFQAVVQVVSKVVVRWQLQPGQRRGLSPEVLELLQLVPLPHQEDYDSCLDWATKQGEV